jgi:hypothetical protein
MCVVCAFVCFSHKEMPDAEKLLAQKPMPPACCCYCGSVIKEGRFKREATEKVLAFAAAWRSSVGKQPLKHAKHVCGTHNSPQQPAATEVRKRMYNPRTLVSCVPLLTAHCPVLLLLYILFLHVYRHQQCPHQHLLAVHSATSPTSLHCVSPHLHAALTALPAGVRNTHICHRSSDTLSLC